MTKLKGKKIRLRLISVLRNRNRTREDDVYLVFDLMLLGILERNVVFG